MAAWTAGFELANLSPDTDRACLILETGVTRRFRYAAYRRSAETEAEARGWKEAKQAARCAHCPISLGLAPLTPILLMSSLQVVFHESFSSHM